MSKDDFSRNTLQQKSQGNFPICAIFGFEGLFLIAQSSGFKLSASAAGSTSEMSPVFSRMSGSRLLSEKDKTIKYGDIKQKFFLHIEKEYD